MRPARIDLLLMSALAGGALVLLGPRATLGLDLGDEGLLVSGIARVANGETLYRDLYRTYAPGLYWALAPLFLLLEPDVANLRFLWCGLLAILSGWIYWLARPFAPRWAALFAGATPFLIHPPLPRTFILFAWVAALALCRGLIVGGRSTRSWVGFGIGIGALGLLRQDAAGFGLIVGATTLGLSLFVADPSAPAAAGRVAPVRTLLRAGLAIAGGAALVWIPVAGLFAIQGSLHDAFDQLVLAGMRGNAAMDLPFPELARMASVPGRIAVSLYYLPGAAALVGIGLVTHAVWTRRFGSAQLVVLQWTLFSIGVHSALMSRPDWAHITPVLSAPALLAAYAAGRLLEQARPGRAAGTRWAAGLALALVVAWSFAVVASGLRWARIRSAPAKNAVALAIPGASLRVGPAQAAELRALVERIQVLAAPGEPMFVAGYAPMVYFLADRWNPGRHDYVLPGFASPEIQDEIVGTLEQGRVGLVVLDRVFYDNDRSRQLAQYAPRVAGYLASSYRADGDIGRFTLLVRGTGTAP